ncbi:MAG: hypothetical protein PHE59_04670 [Patescibacteria group bacterium]|nr:hypothetical protein [Patescibacteria group bacterium]MDD5164644.1 hypothetical protein [Patescibacteria group bacterium]MDD5534830.1 hypothetical protein [Patescibacteria group bacterium]
MIIQLGPSAIPYNKRFQFMCCCSYYKHPHGCPNFGKKSDCPPNLPLITKVFDFGQKIYLIYTEFDLAAHAERMLKMHPDWSEHQIYCVLYWQSKARVFQRKEEGMAIKQHGLEYICRSPEAHGVNITELMKTQGIVLEWPPRKITRLVSLGGWKIK